MRVINREKIKQVLAIREEIKRLNLMVEEAKLEEKGIEGEIIEALKVNTPIAFMPYRLEVDVQYVVRPSWKGVVEERLGPHIVKEVISQTEPKITERLLIKPHSNLTNVKD